MGSPLICEVARKIAAQHHFRARKLSPDQLSIYVDQTHEYGLMLNGGHYKTIQGKRLRLVSEKFWRRVLNAQADMTREHTAMLRHKVGSSQQGLTPYCSQETFKALEERSTLADAKYQLEASRRNQASKSSRYAKAKRARANGLYLKLKAAEKLAESRSYSSTLITLTCPEQYHPGSVNYSGLSFRDAHAYLRGLWSKLSRDLGKHYKAKDDYFGIRVTEVHVTGVPHWHILLYSKPELIAVLENKLRRIWTKESLERKLYFEENVRSIISTSHSKEKIGATSYVFKRIAASLDKEVAQDGDDPNYRATIAIQAARVRGHQLIGMSGLTSKHNALRKIAFSKNAPPGLAKMAKELALPVNIKNRRERQLCAMISLLEDSSLSFDKKSTRNSYGEPSNRIHAIKNSNTREVYSFVQNSCPSSSIFRIHKGGVIVNDSSIGPSTYYCDRPSTITATFDPINMRLDMKMRAQIRAPPQHLQCELTRD